MAASRPLRRLATLTALLLATAVAAQESPPVVVKDARGEFVQRLAAATPPKGNAWRQHRDRDNRVRIQFPRTWKVEALKDEEAALQATPPGRATGANLVVVITPTGDGDPLFVTQAFAAEQAAELPKNPSLAAFEVSVTDSAYIEFNGLKCAVVGARLSYQQQPIRLAQLVYVGFHKIIMIQFTAPPEEFDRHAAVVAQVMRSFEPSLSDGTENLVDD